MQPSAYLAAVLVFAVPTSALTNLPQETLLALNTVPTFGLSGAEFGRFFDAGGHHAFLSVSELYEPEANIRAGTTYMVHLFERAWKKYHMKGAAVLPLEGQRVDQEDRTVRRFPASADGPRRGLTNRRTRLYLRDE